MAKVGIVGAGIAGMSAAVHLRAKGHEVTVFEAAAHAGGKLHAIESEGYRFDAGPSLFTMPHLLDGLFESAGKNPRDYYHYQKIEPGCQYFWPDGTTFSGWSDSGKFAREAQSVLGVPAKAVEKYFKKSSELYDITEKVFLRSSLHRWQTYLRWSTLVSFAQLYNARIFSSMHSVNSRLLRNPKLVQLFDRYATYNGSDPYQAPGTLTVIPTLEHRWGTFLPKGGMHQITKSLHRLAADIGVNFRFNEAVETIAHSSKKVKGIQTTRAFYPFDMVVSNMDVVPTYQKLLKGVAPPMNLDRQERSSSALIYYWGVKQTFPQLGLHNILWSDEYESEFKSIFSDKTIGDDPTVYINITSKHENTDAPEGCENWFILINAPCDEGQDWKALAEKTRRIIIAKINKMLDCDIEPLIETEHILDPPKIGRDTSSFKGSLYGTSSNHWQAAFLRHPNFSKQIDGLYFCGGSVHPGGGIPLCLLSGKIVSEIAP